MRTMRTITIAGLGLTAALLLGACGSDGGDTASTASSVAAVASSQVAAAQQTASSLVDQAKQTASSLLASTRDLEGEWKLGLDVLPDTSADLRPTITFAGTEVSGFSGCNTYTTTATIEGNTITLGPVAGTKKACGAAATKIEAAYLERLAGVKKFVVAADKLVMTGDSGELVFSR
jgi:heat shock protein HslJ